MGGAPNLAHSLLLAPDMKIKLSWWRLLLVASTTLAGPACVGGSVDPDDPMVVATSFEAKLTARARVITDDVQGALISDERGVLRFDKARVVDVADVAVGDVVISGVGEGFLREVVQVRTEGNTLVLETRPAKLTDAIDTASFAMSTAMAGEPWDMGDGVLASNDVETRHDALTASLDLSGIVLYRDRVGGADIVVDIPDGHISFEPSVDVDISIRGRRLESIRAVASGTLSAEVNIRVQATGNFAHSNEVELTRLRRRKVVTQWVGWVPVVEVITVRYFVGYEADVEGGVTAQGGARAWGTIRAGGEYRGGRLRGISGVRTGFHLTEPEWEQWAEGSVRGYVRPQIDIAIYGVAGPGISVETWLQLSGEQRATAEALTAHWTLDAGISANVLFRMQLFGSGRTYSREVYGYEKTLGQGSWELERYSQPPPMPAGGEDAPGRSGAATEGDSPSAEEPVVGADATCGGRPVQHITRFGDLGGSLTGSNHHEPDECEAGAGPESVYSVALARSGSICLRTKGSAFDPVLYVRTVCDDLASEAICNDDAHGVESALTLSGEPGVLYYVFVDGFDEAVGGDYTLEVTPGPCQ